jgi:hypothetical protein
MPALRDHPQTGAADRARDFTRQLRRRRLIAIADQDQGLAFDRAKPGSRIRPSDDRLLLPQECVNAGLFGHHAHRLFQAGVIVAIAMDVERKSDIGHFRIAAAFGERDYHLASLRLFRRLGAGAGIEKRKLCHPVRRLAHDFEGDIAAHRQPDERKARRRRRHDAPCDGGHAVIAGMVCDHHRAEPPKHGNLPCI